MAKTKSHPLEETAGTLAVELHLELSALLDVRLDELRVGIVGGRVLRLVQILWHFAAPLDERRALGIPVLVHLRPAPVLRHVARVHALQQHRLPLLGIGFENLDLAQRVLVEELLDDVEGECKYLGRCTTKESAEEEEGGEGKGSQVSKCAAKRVTWVALPNYR